MSMRIGETLNVSVVAVDRNEKRIAGVWAFVLARDTSRLQHAGCLPLRDGHECTLTALEAGSTTLRVSIGDRVRKLQVEIGPDRSH